MKAAGRFPGELIVWMVSYAFFLLTLVSNFSAAHDSINYLNGIVRGTNLFHQHHLLYHVTAHYWLMAWKTIFSSTPDHFLIEAYSAVWGSSSLALIYLFYRNRFGLSIPASAAGVIIIGLSYGMWFYSVNIEVYAPPIFFILSILYIVTRKNFSQKDIWNISLLHCFAILFHQVNILFAIVILYVILTNRHGIKTGSAIVQYALTGFIITAGAYFIAGWIIEGHHSFPAWIGWMEGYTVGHGYWQPLSLKTPLHVIAGFAHAFIGGHFIFQLPGVREYFQRSFDTHGLNDELFLSAHISPALALTLAILTAALVFFLLTLAIRFTRQYKIISRRAGIIVKPILLCIVTYSLFFCFWMPEILEFWILQMALVWLLVIGMLPVMRFPFRLPQTGMLFLIGALLFFINFFGSLKWLQDINNDWYFARVEKISHAALTGDLVFAEQGWILKDFLKYYTAADIVSPDDPGYSQSFADSLVAAKLSAQHKVYIYPSAGGGHNAANGPRDEGVFVNALLNRYPGRRKLFNEKEPLIYIIE